MSESKDYRKFYTCPNKDILESKVGYPSGYVTKDGMWAAVPLAKSKKFVIINNGSIVHTSKNYPSAVSYIEKNLKKKR
tara:strand:+ start:208 stop:441 length:234 start_codon:yes stop_codon:yes gene_type:complete